MLQVNNLYFDYPNKRALDNVSFTISQGSITAIVGPNGAGKTTLMRCIAGLEAPYSGNIMLNEISVTENPKQAHANIGYLSDFFGVYKELTVEQCLIFAAQIREVEPSIVKNRIADTLELLDLTEKAKEKASNLSRGMRQRLGIAQAMIHYPKLLILDEPASGLDPEARINLSSLIKKLQKAGITIVVSSHILSELEDYCTEMVVIRDAKIVGNEKINLEDANTPINIHVTYLGKMPNKAADILKKQSNLVSYESSCVFELDNNQEHIAEILASLVNSGLKITSFKPEEKKLQDHYMQLAKETQK